MQGAEYGRRRDLDAEGWTIETAQTYIKERGTASGPRTEGRRGVSTSRLLAVTIKSAKKGETKPIAILRSRKAKEGGTRVTKGNNGTGVRETSVLVLAFLRSIPFFGPGVDSGV